MLISRQTQVEFFVFHFVVNSFTLNLRKVIKLLAPTALDFCHLSSGRDSENTNTVDMLVKIKALTYF